MVDILCRLRLHDWGKWEQYNVDVLCVGGGLDVPPERWPHGVERRERRRCRRCGEEQDRQVRSHWLT